jgi:type IX secretion system PorP/SprF family membrane protein
MKIKLFLITIVLALVAQLSFSQDIHFSQVTMTPLQINPAMAGAEYDLRGIVNYRNQWRSVSAPYVTYAASYDMNFANKTKRKGFWAGGINAFSDKAGDSRMMTNQMNLVGAYHVYINENNTFGLGAQAGFFQRSLTADELSWGNQYSGQAYDPNRPTGETGTGTEIFFAPDFATGLTWCYKKGEHYASANDQKLINAGVSIHHINKPEYAYSEIDYDKLNFRLVGHVNAFVGIPNTNISLQPSLLYMMQGSSRQLLAGSNIVYKLKDESKYTGLVKGASMGFGAFYRNKDAMAITSFLQFANYLVGISYDVNTSYLKSQSYGRGGIEIALRYVLPNPFGGQQKSSSRFN